MKNLVVSLTLMLTLGVASSFATVGDNPRVQQAFARQFAGAENVKWGKLEGGITRAAFTLGGVRAEAYFSDNAELLGTIRNLFYNQLPLSVMQTVNTQFNGGIVLEIREITNAEGTSYRVILEQKDKRYSVKVNSFGEVTEKERRKS